MAQLAAPDINWVYFVELQPFHIVNEATLNIFVATQDVFFDANDPDAPNRLYNGIVDIALSVTRSLQIASGRISADAQPDYGGLTVKVDDEFAADTTNGLPAWKACAWDGYPYRVLRGVRPKSGPWRYADLELIAAGATLGGNVWGASEIELPIAGLAARLDEDIAAVTYLEADGADLKGKVKRRGFGHVLHATPVLIDAENEIWDVAPIDGFHSDVKVYQGGLEYASYAVSSPPDPGEVYVDMANGRVETNGLPTRPLTVSFVSGFADGAVTKADIVEALLDELGFDPSEIDSATFTALNTADDSVVGYYAEGPTSAKAVVDAILGPGAFHTEDAGKFQVFQLAPPDAATPDEADVFIDDDDLILPEFRALPDIVPPSRLDLNYAPCLTSFNPSDIVFEALDADRAFISNAWRIEPYDNPDAAVHRRAKPLPVYCRMAVKADAAAEAARLGPMLAAPIDQYSAPIAATPFGLKLHAQVWVRSRTQNIDAAFRAISVGDLTRASRVNTILWRPRP